MREIQKIVEIIIIKTFKWGYLAHKTLSNKGKRFLAAEVIKEQRK